MKLSIPTGVYALLIMAGISLVGCGGGHKTATSVATAATSKPISPAEYVYAINSKGNSISQYQIAANGALLPLATPSVATGSDPLDVTADPKGRFLYITSQQDGTVSQYQIGANGALTPLNPATVPAGTGGELGGPRSLTVDAAGRFLYVINGKENNLRVYTIGSNGSLQAGRVVPTAIPIPIFIVAHPQLPVLYIGGDTVSQYQIGADGNLTPLNPGTVQTPVRPSRVSNTSLSLTPNGKFAYLGFEGSSTPAQYKVNADGTLTVLDLANSNLSTDPNLVMLTEFIPSIDPGSRFVYTLGGDSSGVELLASKIGADGRLTPINLPSTQLADVIFNGLTFDPSGQFVYVPGPLSDSLVGFRLNSNGTLSTLPVPSVGTGLLPFTALSVQRSVRRRAGPSAASAHTFITVRRLLP